LLSAVACTLLQQYVFSIQTLHLFYAYFSSSAIIFNN